MENPKLDPFTSSSTLPSSQKGTPADPIHTLHIQGLPSTTQQIKKKKELTTSPSNIKYNEESSLKTQSVKLMLRNRKNPN